ncbi:hypothetical protein PHLGIDRAFT_73799 [Phlebiopsis gigantea 11061_1 CR5-6]|uniref:Uncharacterized protein n=1 Tax=Phlebiopsis gigantea (strain 11061_1 CR5-6) TaxID=745531 RepID=A0A0C3PIC4_PHLG1|nr:hypothetical protein PHLGIDRAFT_73799 [Phlebiopsis gigantea 11061_1 CR5-6]
MFQLPAGHDLQVDDIMTVYHPHSQLEPTVSHFEDYRRTIEHTPPIPDAASASPQFPFATELDFRFGEVTQSAHLSRPYVAKLLSIIHDAMSDPASFTIKSFSKSTVTAVYKKQDFQFEVIYRPLWDWIKDQLSISCLVPHTTWDAQRLYKYDGEKWVQFCHEPYTCKRWWSVQSKLPNQPNAKPVCLMLYADKTRLSSFGTAKGYPVMLGIANFAMPVRNGIGLGSARIVGWLPCVNDDAEEKGKRRFTDFKRVVWHSSFQEILSSISSISNTGYMFPCADGVVRILYPFIHSLIADFEEQCVMALTRGIGGLYPCPRCLVPKDKQLYLEQQWKKRKTKTARLVVGNLSLNAGEREEKLKKESLRDVHNAMWTVAHSSPHKAAAFDRLHFNNGGLVSDHLWPELQDVIVDDLGRDATKQVNQQMDLIPRWRNLNHFSSVVQVYFADGSKYEDIGKLIIFASHNVITESSSKRGYLLLRCMRAYIEHDMHLALEVHTEHTLESGRAWLQKYSELTQKYAEKYPHKNWHFPKMHQQQHSYSDIEDKGVTANTNTKTFEKRHNPLKEGYDHINPSRNVGGQLLTYEHRAFVALTIRHDIDALARMREDIAEEFARENSDIAEDTNSKAQFGNIYLGAVQSVRDFKELLAEHGSSKSHIFNQFRLQLTSYLNTHVRQAHEPQIRLRDTDKVIITEYRYLKVDFESTVTWCMLTDYLHCNPSFWGHPRYDGVAINASEGKTMFGQLEFVFTCYVHGKTVPLAMILPYDAPIGPVLRKDKHLGLYRVRTPLPRKYEFVPVNSIVRGALLVEDLSTFGDCFVVDVTDTDMFLRMKKIEIYRSSH